MPLWGYVEAGTALRLSLYIVSVVFFPLFVRTGYIILFVPRTALKICPQPRFCAMCQFTTSNIPCQLS